MRERRPGRPEQPFARGPPRYSTPLSPEAPQCEPSPRDTLGHRLGRNPPSSTAQDECQRQRCQGEENVSVGRDVGNRSEIRESHAPTRHGCAETLRRMSPRAGRYEVNGRIRTLPHRGVPACAAINAEHL